MGLFDEIKKSIEEAIEEADQDRGRGRSPAPARPADRQQRADPAGDRPRSRPNDRKRKSRTRAQAQAASDSEKPPRTPEPPATDQKTVSAPPPAQSRRKVARPARPQAIDSQIDAAGIRHLLRSPAGLRQAVLLHEVLGGPRARRRR